LACLLTAISDFHKGIYSMFDPIDFDPALVAAWPPGRPGVYGAEVAGDDAGALALRLETKAAPSPAEELYSLLNDMTAEMRLQFEAFRKIRQEADAQLAGDDEAGQKLAKADLKAANDALSLIVRTIEKIDSLQRSLAHDRETALERQFDEMAFQQLLADTERTIEARVAERLAAAGAERGATGPDAARTLQTGPPDA
jgi:hypothetical protein